MRANILNKTVKKDNIPQALTEINKRSAAVYGDIPQKKAELSGQLAEAGAELREAKASLDAAGDLNEYNEASEAVKRAEMKERFVKDAIAKIDEAQRMSETEYSSAVNACCQIVEDATTDYRTKAAALMNQLKEARDSYLSIVAAANQTLVDLDAAANVLQTKYRNEVLTFQGAPDVSRPSSREWERHTVRFTPSDAARMGTESNMKEPGKPHDSVLTAAWQAAYKGFPHRSF